MASLLDKLRSTGFSHEVFIPKKLYYNNEFAKIICRNREILLKNTLIDVICDINLLPCNNSVI